MRDTFSKLNSNEYISSGPTKMEAFRSRSKSIAGYGKAPLLSPSSGYMAANLVIQPDGGVPGGSSAFAGSSQKTRQPSGGDIGGAASDLDTYEGQ